MSSEHFSVLSVVFNICFDCNFYPLPCITAAIFFSLNSTEPVTDMKIPSETENHLLSTTASGLKSNDHEKRAVGHSPRYSRTKTFSKSKSKLLLVGSRENLTVR